MNNVKNKLKEELEFSNNNSVVTNISTSFENCEYVNGNFKTINLNLNCTNKYLQDLIQYIKDKGGNIINVTLKIESSNNENDLDYTLQDISRKIKEDTFNYGSSI